MDTEALAKLTDDELSTWIGEQFRDKAGTSVSIEDWNDGATYFYAVSFNESQTPVDELETTLKTIVPNFGVDDYALLVRRVEPELYDEYDAPEDADVVFRVVEQLS